MKKRLQDDGIDAARRDRQRPPVAQAQLLESLEQTAVDENPARGAPTALFVINLEPRKMAGELSEGMILDIGHADGLVPVLALPEKPVPNGTRAG